MTFDQDHPADRRAEVEALFEAALELTPEGRAAFLGTACPDPDLREEVEALLSAHHLGSGLLERGPMLAASLLSGALEGKRIGPYRLVRLLGRGGMGTVYLAERDDGQFRRQVAIKLILPGPASEEMVSRFLAERQILASLQHPHIARLLDGGVTGEGLPYLIMEYVDGLPLDEFCRRRQLSVEERLHLIATVARTVHFAHRNLVVHRDLKPTNILVTADGRVQLLDFGIAKLLGPDVADDAPRTRAGLRLMTPEYASPEQIRGDPITTASDIYSLGVVAYELLAGVRPFGRRGQTLRELERLICEQEPPRASTAAPAALRHRLRGDPDRILEAALRREPELRYGSAELLAEDIDRALRGQPLLARGETAGSRARKFVRRHRTALILGGLAMLALAGYAGTVTVQNRRIQLALDEARAEAERTTEFTDVLVRLFGQPGGHSAAARQLLEQGVARARLMEGRPSARAGMLEALGRVYRSLGEYEQALPLLEEAVRLREDLHGTHHLQVVESRLSLADVYELTGRWAAAESLLLSALATQRALDPGDHPRRARILAQLATVLREVGRYSEAEPVTRQSLAMRRRIFGEDHEAVAESVNLLAALLRRMGRYAEAEPLYRQALEMRRRMYVADHPVVAEAINNLATQLEQNGDLPGALSLYREALAIYGSIYGDGHPFTARVMNSVARTLTELGRLDEAEVLAARALATRRTVYGERHPEVARSLFQMALIRQRRADPPGAERYAGEALSMFGGLLTEDHPEMVRMRLGFASILADAGRPDSAEGQLREAVRLGRAVLGPQHPYTAEAMLELGNMLGAGGDVQQAESLMLAGVAARRAVFGDRHPWVAEASDRLAALRRH